MSTGLCSSRVGHLDTLLKQASKPRVSNITFSTVTSATGLPTIAAEPSRPRSSSYWKPEKEEKAPPSSSQQPQQAIAASTVASSLPTPPTPHQQDATRRGASESAAGTAAGASCSSPSSHMGAAPNTAAASATTTTLNNNATKVVNHNHNNHVHNHMHEVHERCAASSSSTTSKENRRSSSSTRRTPSVPPVVEPDDNSSDSSSRASCDLSETSVTVADGTVFTPREIDADPVWREVSDWSFPIFRVADRFHYSVLTRLTYTVFKQADLFRIFKISPSKFFNFFHALERGYWEIPYHNRIHAADVLHACYYLTCHPVKAFQPPPASPDSPLPPQDSPLPAPICESMSNLEVMALYTAAAMHDYDHPGRTNAFLVAAEDRKAILYNDRSVLENHHAAESWKLLCHTSNYFIDALDQAETKRFRYLVLEYILATDLKQHFDIIMQFNEKATDMDLTSESDRVLVSQVLIKFADINSPSKPYPLHRQWTDRICEEFYEQGDEEKRRGMSISPYMDRNDPAVAKLQDSFIAHIVSPLAIALNEVGLLPVLPGLEESELIINLKHNHQKWLLELESAASSGSASSGVCAGSETIEEEESNQGSPDNQRAAHLPAKHTTSSIDSLDGEEQFEMCTIHENDEEEYL